MVALGDIAVGSPNQVKFILDFFCEMAELVTKQIEIHFTIGESLCKILDGWSCPLMEVHLDISDVSFPQNQNGIDHGLNDSINMEQFLNKLLFELIPKSRPAVRKGLCVWLLCLVQYCGSNSVLKVLLDFLSIFLTLILKYHAQKILSVFSRSRHCCYYYFRVNCQKFIMHSQCY